MIRHGLIPRPEVYLPSLITTEKPEPILDQLQKPDMDYIEGLSPTIAIEQRSAGASPRSIIATTTEIYDYLRLLFAHIGIYRLYISSFQFLELEVRYVHGVPVYRLPIRLNGLGRAVGYCIGIQPALEI